MEIIKTIEGMRDFAEKAKSRRQSIGFVPTMGYLHEGHLSLLRKSKKENDLTVLSIFVNPVQFSPTEDFTKYPRNLKRDKSFAKKEKVDIMFYPSVDGFYPDGYRTYVQVEGMSDKLCGKFRPGHFRGVATVVLKLVNIIKPDRIYLGQKDAQQVTIIKRMLNDLDVPVAVRVLPTVREVSGLAMSSRNTYLTPAERLNASILYKALLHAKQIILEGEHHAETVTHEMRAMISISDSVKIDYIECVNADTLEKLDTLNGNILIALAVWFNHTRLIDNILVRVK